MTLQKVKKQISKHKTELAAKFAVKSLSVFGSVARGEGRKKSDVDFLVEFSTNEVGLFEFVELKFFLESILHARVDLVTRDAIRERMLAQIERDAVRVA